MYPSTNKAVCKGAKHFDLTRNTFCDILNFKGTKKNNSITHCA